MKLTYDPKANIAYIALRDGRDGRDEVEAIRLSEDVVLDVSPDGKLVGIELLNANEQIGRSDDGQLIYTDPESGEERSIRVA